MTEEEFYPKFGEVYLYSGSPHAGDSKTRPGIVVSKDIINSSSRCIQVVPITSEKEVPVGLYAVRFALLDKEGILSKKSIAMCDKITTIKKNRIKSEALGCLSVNEIEQLKKCLKMAHENQPVITLQGFGA